MFYSLQPIYKIEHFKNTIILNFIKQPDGQKELQTQTETRLITDQTLRQNHGPRTKVINKINKLTKPNIF